MSLPVSGCRNTAWLVQVCSSDFVGHRSSGIVDAPRTVYMNKRVNLYVWYDNEFGYSCQVMRVLQKLAGIKHAVFPPEPQQ